MLHYTLLIVALWLPHTLMIHSLDGDLMENRTAHSVLCNSRDSYRPKIVHHFYWLHCCPSTDDKFSLSQANNKAISKTSMRTMIRMSFMLVETIFIKLQTSFSTNDAFMQFDDYSSSGMIQQYCETVNCSRFPAANGTSGNTSSIDYVHQRGGLWFCAEHVHSRISVIRRSQAQAGQSAIHGPSSTFPFSGPVIDRASWAPIINRLEALLRTWVDSSIVIAKPAKRRNSFAAIVIRM